MHPLTFTQRPGDSQKPLQPLKNQRPQTSALEPTERIVAHVLCGSEASEETGLAGCFVGATLKYLACALNNIQGKFLHSPKKDILITRITQCRKWYEILSALSKKAVKQVSCEIVQAAKELRQGNSILFPGGWFGKKMSGHCMLYELTKTADKRYRLRVINSGGGLKFHCGIANDQKASRLPALTYENIPFESLFYQGNRSIFHRLIHVSGIPQQDTFEADRIYSGVLRPLAQYRDDSQLFSRKEFWISPQREGTCSWNAPRSYLRLILGRDLYKEVSLRIKIETLQAYFTPLKRQEPSQRTLHLLELGKEGLTRYFSKYQKCLNHEEQVHCTALIMEINEYVEKHTYTKQLLSKQLIFQSNRQPPQLNKQEKVDFQDKSGKYNYHIFYNFHGNKEPITGETAKDIIKQLSINTFNLKRDRYLFCHIVERIASRMVLKQEEWKDASSFQSINNLLNNFIKCCQEGHLPATSRHLNTISTLYLVLWNMFPHLTLKGKGCRQPEKMQELIERLAPPKTPFSYTDQNILFVSLDPSDLKRRGELKKAFHNWCPQNKQDRLDVFKDWFEEKAINNTTINEDDELLFYNHCLHYSDRPTRKTLHRVPNMDLNVAKEWQEVGCLATTSLWWEDTCPEFLQLREAHLSLCNIARGKDSNGRWARPLQSNPDFSFYNCANETNMFSEQYGGENRAVSFKEYSKVAPVVLCKDKGGGKEIPPYFGPQIEGLLSVAFFLKSLIVRGGQTPLSCEEMNQLEFTPIESTLPESKSFESTPFQVKTQDKLPEQERTFLRKLASISTSPALKFVNILNLFSSSAYLLEKPDYRTLFMTQFFQAGSSSEHPLIHEVRVNPGLVDVAIKLAHRIERVALSEKDRPNVEMALFSCFVLHQMSLFAPDHNSKELEVILGKQKERIDHWIDELSQKKNSKEAEALLPLLHLHRLHTYATKKQELGRTELSEIFRSHLVVITGKINPKDPYGFLKNQVFSFVFNLLPLKELNTEQLNTLFHDMLKEAQIPFEKEVCFKRQKKKGQRLFGKYEEKWVVVDLFQGRVIYDEKYIQPVETPFPNQELFGDEVYSTREDGAFSYIDHPNGTFKISQNGEKKKDRQNIAFRPKGDKTWYLFVPLKDFEEKIVKSGIPFSLIKGYQHFYNQTKEEWIFIKKRAYGSFQSALRYKEGANEIRSKSVQDKNDQDKNVQYGYKVAKCPELERIERANCIQERLDKHGQVTHIELPRYDLTFTVDLSGRLQCEQLPQFFLTTTDESSEPLGEIPHTLLLENNNGKKKLIVPYLPIEEARGLESWGKLALVKRQGDDKGIKKVPYCVYSLSSSQNQDVILNPNSQEGTLLLAYHKVHQRDYSKALSLLREISPLDSLSSQSDQVLHWIQCYGKQEKNSSPNIRALSLHAWVLTIKKKREKDPDFVLEKNDYERIETTYKSYLKNLSRILLDLQLSNEDEAPLLEVISSSILNLLYPLLSNEEKALLPESRDSTILEMRYKSLFPQKYGVSAIERGFPKDPHKDPFTFYLKPDEWFVHSEIFKPEIAACLPDLSESFEKKEFVQCYQAILDETNFSHQEIEGWLFAKWSVGNWHKKCPERWRWETLFVLMEAKKQNKKLPQIPTEDSVQSLNKQFFTEIKKATEGVSYKAPHKEVPREFPEAAAFANTRQEHEQILIARDATIEDLVTEKTFHEKLQAFCNEHNRSCDNKLTLPPLEKSESSVNKQSPFQLKWAGQQGKGNYEECIKKDLDRFNQELADGQERLEKERATAENAINYFFGEEGPTHIKTSSEVLEAYVTAHKKSLREYERTLLAKANLPIKVENGRIPHPVLRRLANQTPRLTLEHLQHAYLWDDFSLLVKTNPAFKKGPFQNEVKDLLARHEIAAIELRQGKKGKELIDAIKIPLDINKKRKDVQDLREKTEATAQKIKLEAEHRAEHVQALKDDHINLCGLLQEEQAKLEQQEHHIQANKNREDAIKIPLDIEGTEARVQGLREDIEAIAQKIKLETEHRAEDVQALKDDHINLCSLLQQKQAKLEQQERYIQANQDREDAIELCTLFSEALSPLQELAKKLEPAFKEIGKPFPLLSLLIFIEKSGLTPRLDQTENVGDLLIIARILEKIMGGGKSSIIAAIWAFLMATLGNLPVIFTEPSLLQALGDNLKKSQKTAFGQEVFTLHLEGSQFTNPKYLKKALHDLQEGKRKKWTLILCAEVVQTLDLEFQRLSIGNGVGSEEAVTLLRDILLFLRKEAKGLGDEIDLLLRSDYEVNIPTGERVFIRPTRAKLGRDIFAILIKNPELKEKIGLLEDRQGQVKPEDFQNLIPILAKQIIELPELKLRACNQEIKAGFVTFMSKPKELIPTAFKDYVEKLHSSNEASDQEAAELISLAKHLVADLLLGLFQQSAGQHFGRSQNKNHPAGKVVPFKGVGAPLPSQEIGDLYLLLGAHMMTAIQRGITSRQIEVLRENFLAEAHAVIARKKNRLSLKETAPFQDFNTLVGITLFDAKDPKKVEEALKAIRLNPERALNIEVETVLTCACYHKTHYHSSAQALPNLIEMGGMSGTVPNRDGFNPKTGKLIPDKGALGKIAHTLLERSKQTEFYALEKSSIREILEQADASRVDVILDAGALFKDKAIDEVAKEFLQLSMQANKGKKGVLFFHHKEGEEDNNRLAVGRIEGGEFKITLLKNTRPEALKELGLYPDDCVALYDQLHTTGIDMPLPSRARAIMTIDEHIDLRSLFQTVMRLRKYCTTQQVDFALTKTCQKFISTDKLSINKLVYFALVNQVRKKADSLFVSLRKQLEEVFKECYRKILLNQALKKNDSLLSFLKEQGAEFFQACYQKIFGTIGTKRTFKEEISAIFKEFTASTTLDAPYQQFFSRMAQKPPLEVLQDYKTSLLKQFKANVASSSLTYGGKTMLTQNVTENLEKVIERAKKKDQENLLAKKVQTQENHRANHINIEVEAQNIQDNQVENHEEKRQQQLQKEEWSSYQTEGIPDAKHKPWWTKEGEKGDLDTFITSIQSHLNQGRPTSHQAGLCSLPELFLHPLYRQHDKNRAFDKIFSDHIFVTKMFRYSKTEPLSVFHKSQKLVSEVLVVQDKGEYAFVILSAAEAQMVKAQLAKSSHEGVWLVHAGGDPAVSSPKPLDLKSNKVGMGLAQVNIFGGHATYLENLPDGSTNFLIWLEGNLGSLKDRKHYLNLRAIGGLPGDKFDRLMNQVKSCSIIGRKFSVDSLTPSGVRLIKDPKEIFQFLRNHLPDMTAEQVPFIKDVYIQFLTKQELIQAVPPNKLHRVSSNSYHCLTKEQALFFHTLDADMQQELPPVLMKKIEIDDLISEENTKFFERLTDEQIAAIELKLTLDQCNALKKRGLGKLAIHCMKDEDIKILKDRKDIQCLEEKRYGLVTKNQLLLGLSSHKQIKLPPVLMKEMKKSDLTNKENTQVFKYLTNEQIAAIELKLTLKECETLKENGLRELAIHCMEDEDIKTLVDRKDIQLVEGNRIKYIANKQLKHSQNSQVSFVDRRRAKYLEKDLVVQANWWQVANMQISQFGDMTRMQRCFYVLTQLMIGLVLLGEDYYCPLKPLAPQAGAPVPSAFKRKPTYHICAK